MLPFSRRDDDAPPHRALHPADGSAAIAPWAMGLTGWIYGAAAIALNAIFLFLALAVLANRATDPAAMKPEKRLFKYSILYLFVLFAALVADRWMFA